MARELKKPNVIKESDLKEYAGPIEIDVTPKAVIQVDEVVEEPKEEPKAKISSAAAIPNQPPAVPTISFGAWFQKRSARNPKLKISYREAIEAHFKSIGIKSPATEAEYNVALSHFGL